MRKQWFLPVASLYATGYSVASSDEMAQFRDVYDPLPLAWPWWIWALLALLLGGIAGVAVWMHKRHRIGPTVAPIAVQSAIELARSALQQLAKESATLGAEPFTVRLTHIVRSYLETALQLPVQEQTTEEFLATLHDNPAIPAVLSQHMPGFLEHCDRVKFAAQSIAVESRQQLLTTATEVIETTEIQRLAELDTPTATEGNS